VEFTTIKFDINADLVNGVQGLVNLGGNADDKDLRKCVIKDISKEKLVTYALGDNEIEGTEETLDLKNFIFQLEKTI